MVLEEIEMGLWVLRKRKRGREERFRGGAAMVYGEKRKRNRVKDLWVCEDLRRGNDGFGERVRDGFLGFEREEEGKRDLRMLLWAAMGDGEEIF